MAGKGKDWELTRGKGGAETCEAENNCCQAGRNERALAYFWPPRILSVLIVTWRLAATTASQQEEDDSLALSGIVGYKKDRVSIMDSQLGRHCAACDIQAYGTSM